MSNTSAGTSAARAHLSGKLAMLVGGVLLAVALPYTLSALTLSLPASTYKTALEKHEAALRYFPDSEAQAAYAVLSLAAARSGQGELAAAQYALEASLQRRPQDPLNWARLAYVYGAQGAQGAVGKVGPALQRSFETGQYIPGFMQWRFLIALRYLRDFDEPTQRSVAKQALLLWQTKPNDLIRLARMPVLAPQIESLMRTYNTADVERFLQRRRLVRHTAPIARD